LFAAAKEMHVPPAVAVAKVLQSGDMPGWVLGDKLAADEDADAVVFAAPFGLAIGGRARMYQPPGGEVQRLVPGSRAEHDWDLTRPGFQALSCAVEKFPEEAATMDEHVVVVLDVTWIWLLHFDSVPS
jgi:hypothetical protein